MRPELPVLIKARALIADPAKWGKGDPWERRGTRCAAEAVEDAMRDAGALHRCALGALYDAIGIQRGAFGEPGLPNWNDAPEHTHADVLAAFDKAIASAS